MLVEPETDRPNLLRFERTLGAKKSAFIPGSKFVERGIHRGMPHCSSPRAGSTLRYKGSWVKQWLAFVVHARVPFDSRPQPVVHFRSGKRPVLTEAAGRA